MASETYTDATTADAYGDEVHSESGRRGYGGVGEQVFLWIAWVLAFAVWVFFMQTAVGIMEAIGRGGHDTLMGGLDTGGASYLIIYVLGFTVLGIAIAYGAARWARRDRGRDALTEAATRELYDSVEQARPPRRPSEPPREGETYRPT